MVRNVGSGRHCRHGSRGGRKGGKGGQARIMRGCWAGGQSLQAADSNRTRKRDLRRTRGVRQTKGMCQDSLRRTWYHQRAERRGARARGALESGGHRAVTAAVATPSVSVQDSSRGHGSVHLCRMSWGGFGTGAWSGTARNNLSGRSRGETLRSRGGVTSDH